jgi:hypothetical protein
VPPAKRDHLLRLDGGIIWLIVTSKVYR